MENKALFFPNNIYHLMQQVFEHLNKELFENRLDQPLFTLEASKTTSRGWFLNDGAVSKDDAPFEFHVIALSPFHFNRTDEEIWSTFAHEMVHLWQKQFGLKYPKRPYHNKEWAEKMEEVGLMPSTTGQEGGKRTGPKCSHYIMEGGPFQQAIRKLDIESINFLMGIPEKEDNPNQMVTYKCPKCGVSASAKRDTMIRCKPCEVDMIPKADFDEMGGLNG